MRKFNNFKIVYIIFVGILILCISFLSVIFIGSAYSRTKLKNEIIRNIDSRSEFFNNELNRQVNMIFLEQTNLINDTSVKDINVLWDVMSRFDQFTSVRELSDRLIQLKLLHTIISEVNVCFLNHKISIGTGQIWNRYEDMPESTEYNERIEIGEKGITLTSYAPAMSYSEDANISFFIQTQLGTDKLAEYLNEFIREEDGWLCLLKPDGTYLSGDGPETEEELAEQEEMIRQIKGLLEKDGKNSVHLSGTRMGTCNYNQATGCWILYMFPHDMVDQPLRFFSVIVSCAVILTLALFILFMLFAHHFFVKPIDRILAAMGNHGGQFYIREKRKDEFDYIYERYNDMVAKMNHLVQEKLDAEYRMKLAQLKQLQYQIQPHFLYNSIFAISRMATLDENEEIAEFSKNLGLYYQYITKLNSEWVTVGDELQYLKNYLYIQKTRFGDRIHAEMNEVEPEVCSLKIPPLILQPLVENAYEHGVKGMISGGEIHIHVEYKDPIFSFEVEDNGRGISDEEIREIYADFEKQSKEMEVVHGLTNVYVRIRRIYGENGKLCIEKNENQGTRIYIRIKQEQEKTAHV